MFQNGWVIKTWTFIEIFNDYSFVFGSTGFDPKLVTFVAARKLILFLRAIYELHFIQI